jgi:hypothetical protein
MAASGSAAAISELGDDVSLELVDGTVHGGHPVGHVKDVAQIPWLGVRRRHTSVGSMSTR